MPLQFCRDEDLAGEEAAATEAANLDPEELKDALLQQAQAQRRAVVEATFRPGTGRQPPKQQFRIKLRPLQLSPKPAPTQLWSQIPTPGSTKQFSPMEGVPELRMAADELPQNYTEGGSGSPVKGLVHQSVAMGSVQPTEGHAQGNFSFGGAYNVDDDDNDDYGGFEVGGFDDYVDYGAAVPLPAVVAFNPSRPRPRRFVMNPGIRLRNELPRKSLINPNTGLQEVAGVRRSMRQPNAPLKWWLGEMKVYTRKEHMTMPTILENVQKSPSTPWRTIADPRDHKVKKKKKKKTKKRYQKIVKNCDAADDGVVEVDVEEDLVASDDEGTTMSLNHQDEEEAGEEVEPASAQQGGFKQQAIIAITEDEEGGGGEDGDVVMAMPTFEPLVVEDGDDIESDAETVDISQPRPSLSGVTMRRGSRR